MTETLGKGEESTAGISLPVERYISDSIVSHYANFVLVTNGQYEFYLTFFEAEPPTIYGTPDQIKEQMETLKSIQAKCVARIIIPKELMPRVVEAINTASGLEIKVDSLGEIAANNGKSLNDKGK